MPARLTARRSTRALLHAVVPGGGSGGGSGVDQGGSGWIKGGSGVRQQAGPSETHGKRGSAALMRGSWRWPNLSLCNKKRRKKRGARSARGPHGAGGLPSGAPRRHAGGAGRKLWKRGKQCLYFLDSYAAGTGGLGTRLLPSRSLRSRHQVLAPHAHAGIGTRGPQRAAAERPHLPHRPYPLALHFSKRFGMPAINFSKKLGPPSSAGWL